MDSRLSDQIDELVAAHLAATEQRRRTRAAQRAEMAPRRAAGLARRHATKLARQQETSMTAERAPRCRMTNSMGNRCPNPSIDPDLKAPQVCARHALEGAQLLAEAGAIRIQYADVTNRRAK